MLVLAVACNHGATGAQSDAPQSDAPALVDALGIDATDASNAADPIVAPADMWTWVDFAISKCASGTPTGIGIDPHAGASDVVIYLEGGGACETGSSCWGPMPGANNLAGYDATTFAAAPQRNYPTLDRAVAANPFAAENFVFVPYCTGDMHGGTVERDLAVGSATVPTYFWGATDLDAFLARVAPTFPNATHVWLIGTSAGGFGTMLSFDRVAAAFPHAQVDIIDDSGPAIVGSGATSNDAIFTDWDYVAPAGCSPCTKLSDVLAADRAAQPASHYAFLSFAQDTVISADFGYTLDEYPAVIDAFTATFASDAKAASFIVTNEQSHVVESDPTLAAQYLPWLQAMVAGSASWTNTTYAHP